MAIISALLKNYDEFIDEEGDLKNKTGNFNFIKEGEMIINGWGELDKSFTDIASIFDFKEQTEEEFKDKFGITKLINEHAVVSNFHYGYQGINDDIPAIFVELP